MIPPRQLMLASSVFQLLAGLALTFSPLETFSNFGAPDSSVAVPIQLAGSALLGLGLVNWMSKSQILGGIYGRPLTFGNFLHYFVGAMTLIGPTLEGRARPFVTVLAIVYAAFAFLFGKLLFTNPPSAASGR